MYKRQLRSSFADEHPDVKAQVAGLKTLNNRFRQEVADVILSLIHISEPTRPY